MSYQGKLIDSFSVPIGSGIIAGVASPFVFGASYSDKLGSGFLSGWNAPIAVGASVAGASFVGHISKNWILPMIPNNSYLAEGEGRILTPLLTGSASALFLYGSTDGTMMALGKGFLLGAVSEVGSDYISRTFLSNYM
jgi:hypothetical protein